MEKDLRFAEYFLFTQYSLATFDKCPLKFKKRYLEGIKWENFPDEEVNKRIELGNDFHLFANRYFMSLDTNAKELIDADDILAEWTENLKNKFPINPKYKYFSEYKMRLISGIIKLEANYDLIIVKDESIEIWDFKTQIEKSGHKQLKIRNYENTLQTKVYMYVVKELSHLLADKEIHAKAITMYYWQPSPPKVITEIKYHDDMHKEFKKTLEMKTQNLLDYDYKNFNKEKYQAHCKLCEFNLFCNNEVMKIDFQDEEFNMDDLDWEDIEERY